MKKLFSIFVMLSLTVPVLADDLKPVPVDQAIEQYKSFWKSDTIDPSNHEVWKLYIRKALIPKGNQNREAEYYSTVLTLLPKPRHVVEISINQLYNFLQPVPKVGDVIAVEGHITNHFKANITSATKIRQVKTLVMYIENAEKLPNEPMPAPSSSGSESDEDEGSPANQGTTTGAAPAVTPSAPASAPVPSAAVVPVSSIPASFTPAIPNH